MKNRRLGLSLTVLVAVSLGASAASSAPKAKKPSASSTVLYDAWYSVTLNGKVHYGAYHDRVERQGDRLFYKNQFWKNEEGYLNEEQLGAYAMDDENLTPLFFNFHSTYRSTETNVDGSVKDGSIFSVKATRSGKELPVIKRSVPRKLIFSVFFPAWLSRKASSLKQNQSVSFMTILEDGIENEFATLTGTVRLEAPNDASKKPKTKRVVVDYRGIRSFWYLDESGWPVRIEMPEQKTVIQKTTEAEAKTFLAPAGQPASGDSSGE